MKTYEQVLETVELALARGEYNFCIEFLTPIIETFPSSSKEGANLRTILITALCGINKKQEAKKLCKELLKSYEYKTRDNAKYLMEVIDSPEIKKPENWNISFDNNPSLNKKTFKSLNLKEGNTKEKKFINTIDTPTGETKPFKKGFTFIIFFILLLLIPLLSGCVKIENTLDLSDIDSINNYLKIESKYINKFPWQLKFEKKIKNIYPDSEISVGETTFSFENKNLNLESTKEILKRTLSNASNIANFQTDLDISTSQKNFIFLKKYNYKINIDLQTLSEVEDLEINFIIINPNKSYVKGVSNPYLEITNNKIIWKLIPGKMNNLEFVFWNWNKLIIGITFILFIITIAYLLRFYRFKIGTDLPQLPS